MELVTPHRPALAAVATLVALLVVSVGAASPSAAVAAAQATTAATTQGTSLGTQPPAPTSTAPSDGSPAPIPRIIPLPNSGEAPQDPGDRGGWLQISLFWFVLGALGIVGLLIYREGRSNKRKAAARAAASPTGGPGAAGGGPTPAGTGGSSRANGT
jgi:hypothetical protein